MFINGRRSSKVHYKITNMDCGKEQLAFNISSLNVTPVVVEVDWFKISEP